MQSTTPSGKIFYHVPLVMVDHIVLDNTMDSKSTSPKDIAFSSRSLSSGSVDMIDDFKPLFEKNTLSSEHFNVTLQLSTSIHLQDVRTANIFKKNHITSHKFSFEHELKSEADSGLINKTELIDIEFLTLNESNPEFYFSQRVSEDIKNETKKNIEPYIQQERKKRLSVTRSISKSKLSSKIFSSQGSVEEKNIKECIGISPLQKQVTCEELILKGFVDIDEPLLINMMPLERVNLCIALHNTIKKIESLRCIDQDSLQNQNFKSSVLEDAYIRYCASLSLVKIVQKKLRNHQLINLTEENANNVWDYLSLSGETILPSGKLFTLIFDHMMQLGKNEIVEDKMLSLLMFCSHWLKENQGNRLVKNTKAQIEEIVQITYSHPKDDIQNESGRLSENLKKALCDRNMNCNQINFTSVGCIDFNTVLVDICSQKLESSRYKSMVKMVAKDLCYSQVAFYTQLTPQDFFEENWIKPTMLRHIANHCSHLNAYVNHMIFFEKTFEESIILMKFFLDVGYKCLQWNDFSSACAIGGIFCHSSFNKNSDLWIKVTSSEGNYHVIYEKFNKIFYGESTQPLRSALETCYKCDKFFIPHMGFYMHDVELCKNHPGIIKSGNKDPEFNIIKIKEIYEMIQISLRGQVKWKKSDYKKYTYKTNLLSHVLPSFQPLSS
ncbi:MAG: hypothetical protein H0T62_11515 [Parachlamydiaceae bacterium]|nr:hypothetical protein [Parachlamydiaceae bacterium]